MQQEIAAMPDKPEKTPVVLIQNTHGAVVRIRVSGVEIPVQSASPALMLVDGIAQTGLAVTFADVALDYETEPARDVP